MKMFKSVSAVCLIVILAGICRDAGGSAEQDGTKKDANSPADDPGAKTASKLLASVVHLSDNDIRFRTAERISVFVDPVAGPANEWVVKAGMNKPDLILITHSHGDHFQPAVLREYLKLNPKVVLAGPVDVAKLAQENGISGVNIVKPGRNYTLAGIRFSTVPACFLEGDSHPKANQWVGYVLLLDKARYYVTGDTQPLAEMAQIKADVLFPLLYGCGGNLEQALKMAELTKARIVVPVHTSGQEEVIKKYLAQLPKAVQGAYYQEGKLIVRP